MNPKPLASMPTDRGAPGPRLSGPPRPLGGAARHLFVLGSARQGGNAERLARHAAAHLPAATPIEWLSLREHPLPPFEDRRHEPGAVFAPPLGPEAELLAHTLAAEHLVFVVPVYWYSLPADAKRYLDHWSAWLRVPEVNFRARMTGKTLSVITCLSDDDPALAEPLLQTLRLTADYMGMRYHGALVAYGNRPGDALERPAQCEAAARFFQPPSR